MRRTPYVRKDTLLGDIANLMLFRPVYRPPSPAPEPPQQLVSVDAMQTLLEFVRAVNANTADLVSIIKDLNARISQLESQLNPPSTDDTTPSALVNDMLDAGLDY